MSTYRAPVEDMSFVIDEVLEAEKSLGQLPRFEGLGVGPELTTALLDEAAKLAGDVLAPLRRAGDLEPAQIARKTAIDRLFVITSGPIPPNPAELLSGGKMLDLVELSKEKFDYVILDSPPILGLADALVLADISQASLLVVAGDDTRKRDVESGIKRLQHSRANILGAILTLTLSAGAVASAGSGGAVPSKMAHAPEMRRSFSTASDGWAPSRSQRTAASLSTFTADGSVRGLYVPMISRNRPSRGERPSAATMR